jgi:hypothetical protein
MSGLVYPANLPGLTFDSTRTPNFNTGVQAALSTKESRIAYQQYPQMMFELQYELLRDYVTPSDLKALVGLFMAVGGRFDTFLYSDPAFNTVANMQFAVADGVSTAYQITATYQNSGGPGGSEIIQNFNGVPVVNINRWGLLNELIRPYSRSNGLLQSQTLSNASWGKLNLTASTSATTAPDGTSTAWDLIDSSASNVLHTLSQSTTVPAVAGNIYTFSFFLYNVGVFEAGFVQVLLQEGTGGTNAQVWFNITSGAVTSTFTGGNWASIFSSLTSLGNGWLRISITATKTNASATVLAAITPTTTGSGSAYAGAVSGKIATVWGFQIEQATQSSAYLPTTTSTATVTDYSLGATGIITMSYALAAAIKLLWSGSFFYRVRFDDDSMTVSQFMANFWENKSVKLKQIKL